MAPAEHRHSAKLLTCRSEENVRLSRRSPISPKLTTPRPTRPANLISSAFGAAGSHTTTGRPRPGGGRRPALAKRRASGSLRAGVSLLARGRHVAGPRRDACSGRLPVASGAGGRAPATGYGTGHVRDSGACGSWSPRPDVIDRDDRRACSRAILAYVTAVRFAIDVGSVEVLHTKGDPAC